jgi:hypothetical protein
MSKSIIIIEDEGTGVSIKAFSINSPEEMLNDSLHTPASALCQYLVNTAELYIDMCHVDPKLAQSQAQH